MGLAAWHLAPLGVGGGWSVRRDCGLGAPSRRGRGFVRQDGAGAVMGDAVADGYWAALVPELLVADLARSRSFYCDLCGFVVRYARPEDGFLYLQAGGAQIMLEEIAEGAWMTGPMDPPFGRGINLQIEVAALAPIAARLAAAGVAPFRALHEAWYRDGAVEHGQAQLLVQDPDGYLLRFVEDLGTRGLGDAGPGSADTGGAGR